jgi:hypothetical protein
MVRKITSKRTDQSVTAGSPCLSLSAGQRRAMRRRLPVFRPA